MKKENFVMLILGVLGSLAFSLGLCMCLIEEWGLFTFGVVLALCGAVVLGVLFLYSRKGKEKSNKKINWKFIGKISFGVIGALVFGMGMSLIMVFEQMALGVAVGIVGIFMLLCLIPLFKGLR